MASIIEIIREEVEALNHLYQANFPMFGDRLQSISEVGEATRNPYQFKFDNVGFDEVHYHFDTEEDEYVVVFTAADVNHGIWNMEFGTVGGTPEDVTNRFRVFNIMATLVNITNDFIDRFNPNEIRVKPTKDESRDAEDLRRFKLYLAYIKKNMRPEYYAQEYGDYIVIRRKVKTKPKQNI
jgi:hypothetical protein